MRHVTCLLLCVALTGALPAPLPGDPGYQGQQDLQPSQRSGQYQSQQLDKQQTKDQDQLLEDRGQLLYDQEQQLEDQQGQQSWQQQLSEQQLKDQQKLLTDQEQLEQDRRRNEEDRLQQLRQREQERIQLDQQHDQLLRSQAQQHQRTPTSEEYGTTDGRSDEPSDYQPQIEVGELESSPSASLISDDSELSVVPVDQTAPSNADPLLPASDSLLIYGDGAEHATDDVVHDTHDIRAGSASVRKIVIVNAVSKEALEEDEKPSAVSPITQHMLSQTEEASGTDSITTSEGTVKPTEEQPTGSGNKGPLDAASSDSQMKQEQTNAEDENQQLNNPHASEVEPARVSSSKSTQVQESSKEEPPNSEYDSDYRTEETEVDKIEMQQPAGVADGAADAIQCDAGSACLKAEDCGNVMSSTEEFCLTAENVSGVCCSSTDEIFSSDSAQTEQLPSNIAQLTPSSPEPTPSSPAPTTSSPEPTLSTPAPTTTSPEPTKSRPELTLSSPEPAETAPTSPKLTPASPESTPAKLEPTPTTPEPTPASPEPTPVSPEATPASLEPTPTKPESPTRTSECPDQHECVQRQLCQLCQLCGTDDFVDRFKSSAPAETSSDIQSCRSQSGEPGVCCRAPLKKGTEISCNFNEECVESVVCGANGFILTDAEEIEARDPAENEKLGPYGTFCRLPFGGRGRCCRQPDPEWPSDTPVPSCGLSHHIRLPEDSDKHARETLFGEIPWQATIFEKGTNRFICGGTIVSARNILTSDYCVIEYHNTDIFVRVGDYIIHQDSEPLPYQDLEVYSIRTHPRTGALFNDIAVMELIGEIQFDAHVQPICMPELDQNFEGSRCIISGWGRPAFVGNYSERLERVEVPVVNRDVCVINLRDTHLGHFFRLDDSMVCAGGEKDADACRGDAGGPLACRSVDGSYVLAGVAAWSVGCSQHGVPSVYTSVSRTLTFTSHYITGEEYHPFYRSNGGVTEHF